MRVCVYVLFKSLYLLFYCLYLNQAFEKVVNNFKHFRKKLHLRCMVEFLIGL